jgi:hypothetical protein
MNMDTTISCQGQAHIVVGLHATCPFLSGCAANQEKFFPRSVVPLSLSITNLIDITHVSWKSNQFA